MGDRPSGGRSPHRPRRQTMLSTAAQPTNATLGADLRPPRRPLQPDAEPTSRTQPRRRVPPIVTTQGQGRPIPHRRRAKSLPRITTPTDDRVRYPTRREARSCLRQAPNLNGDRLRPLHGLRPVRDQSHLDPQPQWTHRHVTAVGMTLLRECRRLNDARVRGHDGRPPHRDGLVLRRTHIGLSEGRELGTTNKIVYISPYSHWRFSVRSNAISMVWSAATPWRRTDLGYMRRRRL